MGEARQSGTEMNHRRCWEENRQIHTVGVRVSEVAKQNSGHTKHVIRSYTSPCIVLCVHT